MTKEHIKQDISHLLETITEQVELVYTHEHKMPQLELDIILSNVRKLYEQLLALNKINKNLSGFSVAPIPGEPGIQNILAGNLTASTSEEVITAKAESKEIKATPPPTENIISEPEQREVVEEKIEIVAANKRAEIPIAEEPEAKIIAPPKPVVKHEQKINIQEEVVVKAAIQEEIHIAKKQSKTAASLFDAAPSLGEQFDDAKTLQQKFTNTKGEKSVADKIHHQKIDDLKKAIGINEKFLFINELFEGSLASYNEHIEKINSSSEVNHARSIIDSLITKYNWDADQEIVKKFIDLVERRFL
ncbi:MAG: hypothetical protein ABI723_14600 [Bacteroidia bacterium]